MEVIWQILKARQIPAGMEAFPATDDRGWKIIERVIKESDYYILLLAGRYGSVDEETGISWTEREYDYAHSRGIKILAFIRTRSSVTLDKAEDGDGVEKLQNFISKVRSRHLTKEWSTAEELGKEVIHALRTQMDDDADNDDSPPGWYRGDSIASQASLDEFARLSSENSHLREEISRIQERAATPTVQVLWGRERLTYEEAKEYPVEIGRSWGPSGVPRPPAPEIRGGTLTRPVGRCEISLENTSDVFCDGVVATITLSNIASTKSVRGMDFALQEKASSGDSQGITRLTFPRLDPANIASIVYVTFNYQFEYRKAPRSLDDLELKPYTVDIKITSANGLLFKESFEFTPTVIYG